MKNSIVDLGDVRLSADLALDEVVVTGVRKRLEISPTGYSVDIKNSYLSELGRFTDVIGRVPGISIAPRGKIEVIGKQNPLFVLNGRRLHGSDELQRLNPKNIKTIYVDYSPGPEYDASYDVVVRVETNDKNQEYYSGSLYNQFEHGRKASNYTQAGLMLKVERCHIVLICNTTILTLNNMIQKANLFGEVWMSFRRSVQVLCKDRQIVW